MAEKRKNTNQENGPEKHIKLEPTDNTSAAVLASGTSKISTETKGEVDTKKAIEGVDDLDESFSALDASFSQTDTKETKSKSSSVSLIKDIASGLRDWSFQGRCVFKSGLRKFKTARNQTAYAFSVDFRDSSGIIRVSGFTGSSDIHDKVDFHSIYLISNGDIELLTEENKKYNDLGHSHEIKATLFTSIRQIEGTESDFPVVQFNCVPIASIQTPSKVDVIGIIQEIGDVIEFTNKNNKSFEIRTVVVMDTKRYAINVAFFGNLFETLNLKLHDIVAIRSLTITVYDRIGAIKGAVNSDGLVVREPSFLRLEKYDKVVKFQKQVRNYLPLIPKIKNISIPNEM
jgi:hypothetical protein